MLKARSKYKCFLSKLLVANHEKCCMQPLNIQWVENQSATTVQEYSLSHIRQHGRNTLYSVSTCCCLTTLPTVKTYMTRSQAALSMLSGC